MLNYDWGSSYVTCSIGRRLAEHSAVFVARLHGTGNLELVHPMQEFDRRCLPCCYGCATTIRRAQGAPLECGCLYFNQRKHAAVRGYGYVGVSRFRSRSGCHLFGYLRRSDFLPVGPEKEDEQIERGIYSDESDEDMPMGGGIFGGDTDESDEDGYCGGIRHLYVLV